MIRDKIRKVRVKRAIIAFKLFVLTYKTMAMPHFECFKFSHAHNIESAQKKKLPHLYEEKLIDVKQQKKTKPKQMK